jgi:hypothetical protein
MTRAQKRLQKATSQFSDLLKQTVTPEIRSGIVQLLNAVKAATGGDAAGALDGLQKQIGTFLGKVTLVSGEAPRPSF